MRFLPALVLALVLPQDKGPRKLEWKLPRTGAAVYAFLDKAGKPTPREFVILGSELVPAGNRLVVDRYADLPFPFLFQLPAEPVRSGMGPWEVSTTFFADANDATAFGILGGGGSIRPVHARGRFAVKKIEKKADDEIVTIDGGFSLFELRREFVNNQVNLVVTKNDVGSLATSALFSIPRGLVIRAGFQLKVKGQEREGTEPGIGGLGGLLPAGGRAQGGRGPAEKVFTLQEALELKEQVDLDPEKMRPAIEEAVKKAHEWLKKQQKPNGSWGTPAAGEGPVDLSTTGLVVRALLAAGAPPDDPAVVAGAKALAAPAPIDTWTLSQQVGALAGKGPSKDEVEPLKRLAEELLRRRDPRLGIWGTGGRNDTPNAFSTALAAEALALDTTGAKIPDEVWKGLLDQFTATLIEGTREVELDLELEKDAATLALDPKRTLPGAWPSDYSRRAPNDPFQMRAARRGSSLTHLSALKSLLVASGKLTLDDKQKKSLDQALRKGLALVQYEWTLRTVPPVEGPWSLMRPRYLSLLAQTLALARVLRVAGSDWRADGAFLILREQGTDGSWTGGTDDPVDRTAHLLVFLGAALKR
jgi:hypothetical protein